ncbi:MAG TPA: hypothetical protein VGH54_07790, partial [Mycobacterium sp.]
MSSLGADLGALSAADVSTVLGGVTAAGGWDSWVAGLGSLDSGLGAASGAAGVVPDTGSAVSDTGAVGSGAEVWSVWAQSAEQGWITSPLGSQVDGALNAWAERVDPGYVGDSCGLICNGADGTSGASL